MKFLLLLLVSLCPLFAQGEVQGPPRQVRTDHGITQFTVNPQPGNNGPVFTWVSYTWTITADPSGNKTFTLSAQKCREQQPAYDSEEDTGVGALIYPPSSQPPSASNQFCFNLSYANAITLAPVTAALTYFYGLARGLVAHTIVYIQPEAGFHSAETARADLSTAQPAAPNDAQMIYFDSLTNYMVNLDLTTGAIINQVFVPFSVLVTGFSVRPNSTGTEHEVWAVSSTEITIVDVGTGTLSASIPLASSNANGVTNTGFSRDGATFFYAIPLVKPDSAGNNATLMIFDAASRKLTSTLPLKAVPQALVVAPDGLTVYILSGSDNGSVTYYDVLSGTADLSAQIYTPGDPYYFQGQGPVIIHPDGTRLFWNIPFFAPSGVADGGIIQVFDLTTRQITNSFPYGLPIGTMPGTFQMSQDGSTVIVTYRGSATVPGGAIVMEARYGNIMGTIPGALQVGFNFAPTVFPGPGN